MPGFGLANDGLSLAQPVSSVLALCHLPRDISLCLPEVEAVILLVNPKHDFKWLCTHCLGKSPLLPSVFSTWILHRCTPLPAEMPGHTASAYLCYPVSEPVLHITRTAASQAGVGISCCSFLENICPDQPFYFEPPVMSHTFQSFTHTGDSYVNGVYYLW